MTILPVQHHRLDAIERLLIGIGLTALSLTLLVIATGWSVSGIAFGTGPAWLFGPTREQQGERLYNAYCAQCHGGPVVETPAVAYPPRHNASGHTWEHPSCELLDIVRDGGNDRTRAMHAAQGPAAAVEMPAYKERLSDDDIVAILTYIKSMWTPQERVFQERATQSCPGT
jgi:mono/diheme cytochrome c family protein